MKLSLNEISDLLVNENTKDTGFSFSTSKPKVKKMKLNSEENENK